MSTKTSMPLVLIPLVETAAVNAARSNDPKFSEFVQNSLRRYFFLDWGEMCEEDKSLNDWALDREERIFASYSDKEKNYKIWIITEADRSVTTILFPDEY